MTTVRNSFPWGAYIGDLYTEVTSSSHPLMFDTSLGGIRIEHDAESEVRTAQLIENIALHLIDQCDLPIQVKLSDYAVRKRYHHLARLSGEGAFEHASDSNSSSAQFNRLESLSRHRHHELLSPTVPTLSAFNQQAEFPEPYQLWIVNLNNYPDEFAPKRRIIEWLSAAWEAGVYCIVYGRSDALADVPAVDDALKSLPLIEVKKNTVHADQAIATLCSASTPYELEAINQNMDELLARIISSDASDKADQTQEEDFLHVPIGTSLDGRTPLHFSLGSRSQCYHAFIGGTTGTGKTNLINNLLLGIAQQYSSDQIRLYLMDYKEGVEFQAFKDHPNCERIFLDNDDLQAATDLLESFSGMIEERGKQFKSAQVRDIAEFNQKHPTEPIAHLVLVIDEVHRLFAGSWSQKDHFSGLIKDISRRGRSFGIHFILSTQTIDGTQIDKELMSQINLRISFKLNSTRDAEQIFSYGNTAAFELRAKNYEFVYNAEAGAKEANIIGRANEPLPIAEIIDTAISTRPPSDCLKPEIVQKKTAAQAPPPPPVEKRTGDDVKRDNPMHKSTCDSTATQKTLLANLAAKELIKNPLPPVENE